MRQILPLVECFRPFLIDNAFDIVTDNSALTWYIVKGKQIAMLTHSVESLYNHMDSYLHLKQIYIPVKLRDNLLQFSHDNASSGHVNNCIICRKSKTTLNRSAGLLQPLKTTHPFDIISIDIVGPLTRSSSGKMYILTVYDLFSHFPVLIALPNQKAIVVANALFDHVIYYWV